MTVREHAEAGRDSSSRSTDAVGAEATASASVDDEGARVRHEQYRVRSGGSWLAGTLMVVVAAGGIVSCKQKVDVVLEGPESTVASQIKAYHAEDVEARQDRGRLLLHARRAGARV